MGLGTILKIESTFTLFIAPPGWGKTRMLIELHDSSIEKLIFVSPLRALASELYKALLDIFPGVMIVESGADKRSVYKRFFARERGFLITTPEMCDEIFMGDIASGKKRPLVVFDEFHLFYYWGESFRPHLWEVCMGFAGLGISILGLTATFNDEMMRKWRRDFALNMDQLFVVNVGNQMLKTMPDVIHCYSALFSSSRKVFGRRFVFELMKKGEEKLLYFCKYRDEVDRWLTFCEREGISAIGCKGGEVGEFVKALESTSNPKCIFSTSALSHGVNLPSLAKVFISYPLDNIDFWVQMAGRGGRRGESFEVHGFDRFFTKIWGRIWVYLKDSLFDTVIRVKLFLRFV